MSANEKPEKVPGADRVHEWANLSVGFYFPRAWVRRVSLRKRGTLVRYLAAMWLRANDNNVRVPPRPRWCPKRFIWGDVT